MNSSQSPLAQEVNQQAHYQESLINFCEGNFLANWWLDCKSKPSF